MARTIENKISVATVYGAIDRADLYKEGSDGRIPVMRVVGICTGYKAGKTVRNLPTGEPQTSEWFALTGQFAATNLKTGKVYRAGKCFLPNAGTDIILGCFLGLDEGAKPAIEFAFEVTAVRDDKAATGYVWETASLIEPSADDPMEKLLKQASIAALPAPEPEKPVAKGKEKAHAE